MIAKRPNPFVPAPALGWPLLPVPDATGSLAWPDLETSIRQTIRAILMTRPGERLLARRLGAGLQDFLHEPNSVLTRRRLRDAVREALLRHEPRIRLVGVDVEPEGEREERVRIAIGYEVIRTGRPGTLAIAMMLGS
jgi:uncharacterized protein